MNSSFNSTFSVSINSSIITSQRSWAATAYATVFAIITGGLLNLTVLVIFIFRASLRTSFGVYLMNLLIVDGIIALVCAPFNLVEQLSSQWPLGYDACWFRSYSSFVFEGNIIWGHFLIAVNRIWAVIFPFSYRTHHSTKVAIILCASVWTVLHVLYIPTVNATAAIMNSTADGTPQCFLDIAAIGVWSSISQIVIFDVPIISVILVYPLVCHKSFFSNRKQRIAPHGVSAAGDTRRTLVSNAVSGTVHPSGSQPVADSGDGRRSRASERICGREITGSRTGFVTLTLMTLSVLICLMPNEAYWTMMMVVDTDPPGALTIVKTLQRFSTVFDPILIVLGNSELRRLLTHRTHWR